MEKVHTSLLLLLTLLIASFTLTASTNPQAPNFKNQNAKNVKEEVQKDPTSIPYPYASATGFQGMEIGEEDDKADNGYGGPQQGYYGYPFSSGILGFPRGIFGFPRGLFGFPLGFRGFPGGYGGFPGGYGGFPGGYGGYPGGYGGGGGGPGGDGGSAGGYGGGGPGHKPGGGGYAGYGGKAEVKGKEVNRQD